MSRRHIYPWTALVGALMLLSLVGGCAIRGLIAPRQVATNTPAPTATAVPATPTTGPTATRVSPTSTPYPPADERVARELTPVPMPVEEIGAYNASEVAALALWASEDPHAGYVTGVAFADEGTRLASNDRIYGVTLWNLANGTVWFHAPIRDLYLRGLSASHDGTVLSTVSAYESKCEGLRWLRLADDIQLAITCTNYTMCTCSAFWTEPATAFATHGSLLATGPRDIEIYDLTTGKVTQHLDGLGQVTALAFSPDEEYLAVGYGGSDESWPGDVQLWRLSDGSLVRSFEHHANVLSLAFTSDGALLASPSAGGVNVRLWRVADGALQSRLETGSPPWRIVFSRDDSLLAVGLANGDIQLWRVADAGLLATLVGHDDDVTGIAFSPDGTLLASGSWDRTIRLWGVPPP